MNNVPIELVESREANAALRSKLAAYQRTAVKCVADLLIAGDRRGVGIARALATALDGAGLNVDNEVDEFLDGQGLGHVRSMPPSGLDVDSSLWTDWHRETWDLSRVWVAEDGVAWAWTGYMGARSGEPIMRKVDDGASLNPTLSAIQIFDGPLTRGGPRPTGFCG